MQFFRFASGLAGLLVQMAGALGASATQPAAAVRRDMLVSTDWLADHLDDARVAVIHVAKTRTGYDAAHIPGARFMPWSEIAQDRDGVLNEFPPVDELTATVRRLGIDRDTRIVLYDEEQGIPSARAYVVLDYLGLGDRAALLDGQLAAWKAEGRTLSSEAPAVRASSWQPQALRPDIIVHLQEMRRMVENAEQGRHTPPVIDARPAPEYAGEKPSEHVARPGHIPGATNVPSAENYQDPKVPRLRPATELLDKYAAAGAKPGRDIVVYCRTGASASLDYFVSKYLGYNPRLYDGSFSHWSAQADTPVAKGRDCGSAQTRTAECTRPQED